MNILFVGENILGSNQKVTWEAIKKLSEKHKVYVNSNPIKWGGTEDNIGVHTTHLWSKSVFGSFELLITLLRFIRQYDIDIIYVLSYKWLPVVKLAATLNKIPVIAHLGSFITEEYSKFMSPFKFHVNRFLQSIFLLMLSDRDLVWSPSKFTEQRMKNVTRARIMVIPTFIDEQNRYEIKSNKIKEDLVGEKYFILYVGRLVPVKNLGNFIRSLKKLNKDYKLVLVGDGPQRTKLEKLVEELGLRERVMFLGSRPHKDTLSLMNACDVLVLPSLMDQFPNVVIEALSLQKPVIASNVGGIPEIDSQNLYLVDSLEEMIGLLQQGVESKGDDGILRYYSKHKFHERIEQLFESTVK